MVGEGKATEEVATGRAEGVMAVAEKAAVG
jgi:hypothetical protein